MWAEWPQCCLYLVSPAVTTCCLLLFCRWRSESLAAGNRDNYTRCEVTAGSLMMHDAATLGNAAGFFIQLCCWCHDFMPLQVCHMEFQIVAVKQPIRIVLRRICLKVLLCVIFAGTVSSIAGLHSCNLLWW